MANIVIIDAGDAATTIGAIWRARGHHTVSDRVDDVADASVVVFGGPPTAVGAWGAQLGGKVVVHCGNPADVAGVRATVSQAEALAQRFPAARVVKALNAVRADVAAQLAARNAPESGSVYTSGFFCGDDDEANRVTAGLLGEANLDPIFCGPLANAVLLEAQGLLLATLADRHAISGPFALTIARDGTDRSPLDRWM